MLLGMYRCTDVPGEFVWQPGTLTQAVTKGHWILLEDIDYAPLDVVCWPYESLPPNIFSVFEEHFVSSDLGVMERGCLIALRQLWSAVGSDLKAWITWLDCFWINNSFISVLLFWLGFCTDPSIGEWRALDSWPR